MALLANLESALTGRPAPEPAPAPGQISTTIRNPADGAPEIPGDYVLGFLDRYDQRPERSRDGGTDGYMHVSSLISLTCERRSVLMQMHDIQHWETVSGGHRIMWAQGRATENHIRKGVIASREGRGIWGVWKCACGAAHHEGEKPDEKYRCNACGHALTAYHEPVLRDEEYKITGSPDLTLILPNGYLLVIEIKSMTPDMFDDLSSAKPDHAHQGLMYRDLYRRKGYKVMDNVAVIYGRKQFKWGGVRGKNRVYKEYHVDATSALSQSMIAATYQMASNVKRHSERRSPPNRTVCQSQSSKTAQKCPVAHLCFSLR